MGNPSPDTAKLANIQYRQIRKPLPRTDAIGKATGELRYAGDHIMPGMLYAKVLRSPLASARLKLLDVTKARKLQGVSCILTIHGLHLLIVFTRKLIIQF